MENTTRPLIALGFVVFVLIALFLVNPNFESSRNLFADNASSVSDLGLRFSFRR